MSEIETLRHMNSVSDPLRKVCVANHASFLRIFVNYNLLEVVIIDKAFFLTKVPQNILNGNKAIMI
jgi:hypothetical protein